MTIQSTYKFRKKLLLVKAESSYGVDSTPTNTANAILALNCQIKFEGTPLKRNLDRSFVGAQPSVPVGQHATISFDVEAAGSGTSGTAPGYGPCLIGSGMAETVQGSALTDVANKRAVGTPVGTFTATATTPYAGTVHRRITIECTTGGGTGVAEFTVSAPARLGQALVSNTGVTMTNATPFALIQSATITPTIGTSFEVGDTWTIDLYPARVRYTLVDPQSAGSVVIYYYIANNLHIAVGGRGKASLVFEKNGYPKWRFEFKALDYSVASAALPVGTLSAFRAPEPSKASTFPDLILHGWGAAARSLTLDMGNVVNFKGLLNQESIEIGDRDGKGQMSIIAPPIGSFNPKALKDAGTLDRFEAMIGSGAGKIIRVESPKVQIEGVDYADDEGDVFLDLGLSFQPDSGNDEFVFYTM